MPATSTDSKANFTLLAFTPRQVLLGSQTMKHISDNNGKSNGTISLNLEQKVLLHQSIAHYLEHSGFSKTLKKFRSEAQIEKDNLDGKFVDLEEMCLKYLEFCKDVKANNNNQKEQGKHSKKDGEDNLIADKETESKKKKKKTNQSDSDAVGHQSKTCENFKRSKNSQRLTNGSGPESKVTSEDKVADNKCKEKKKKKSKSASDSLSNGVNHKQIESAPVVTNVKLRNDASADTKTVNGETEKRSKDKKKKRDKSSSEGDVEGVQIADHNKTADSKEDSFKTPSEDVTEKKKKDSKKRKRLTSEEIDVLPADGKADEEPKRRKIENLNECEGGQQSTKMNGNLKNDLNSDKENFGETVLGSDQLQEASGKQSNGKINGDLGNTGEKSSIQRSQKKQPKGSVEPKSGRAFQRVKADEVVFADEKLQDNSYWAKDGAESGYGAKAEEVLGQVRGRGFRHEKTKKKRGTYRGGHIDLQSHSVKFNYSDDDE